MASSKMRLLLAGACVALPAALSACPSAGIPYQAEGGVDCDEGLRESIQQLQLTVNRDVDVLFVIDNSGSMAEEQVALNAGFDALMEQLDAQDANYRIAFTTTDNGNPWCPPGQTTPEGGQLVLSPCTQRLDDFEFNDGAIDARELACSSQCSLDADALTIAPTTTDVDDEPRARPWVERSEGLGNLPPSTDVVEALRCFAPQGINGCGFESPLEAMYLSLIRAQTPEEASYGFLRAGAVLAVVVLSDEADCSYDKNWGEIFDASGNKVFWSDPNGVFPSSAVCWNAGVACTGDPSAYDGCEPANYDVSGAETSNEGDAVLYPMSRYVGLLDGLETEKQQLSPDNELIVTLIAGVEGGGEDWSVRYGEGDDPEQLSDFGVGPGCLGSGGVDEDGAVPPVRMRALAETFTPAGLYSVCEGDYSGALAGLGEAIGDQLLPACYTQCVGDSDPTTPQIEVACRVEQNAPGVDPVLLPECERDADTGHYRVDPDTGDPALPEGADACYTMRMDPDGQQSADPLDDMSPECTAQHFNLEFDLVRRFGVPAPGGTAVSADCSLADCPELSCPGIGG